MAEKCGCHGRVLEEMCRDCVTETMRDGAKDYARKITEERDQLRAERDEARKVANEEFTQIQIDLAAGLRHNEEGELENEKLRAEVEGLNKKLEWNKSQVDGEEFDTAAVAALEIHRRLKDANLQVDECRKALKDISELEPGYSTGGKAAWIAEAALHKTNEKITKELRCPECSTLLRCDTCTWKSPFLECGCIDGPGVHVRCHLHGPVAGETNP